MPRTTAAGRSTKATRSFRLTGIRAAFKSALPRSKAKLRETTLCLEIFAMHMQRLDMGKPLTQATFFKTEMNNRDDDRLDREDDREDSRTDCVHEDEFELTEQFLDRERGRA